MAIYKNANLDISVAAEQNPNYNAKPSVQFSTQDKNTAKYTFTVKQNNKPVDLTGVTASVTLYSEDKSVFQSDATITSATEGKIEYVIPSEAIRHHGKTRGDLRLTYPNGDVLGGLRFSFNIEQALIDRAAGVVGGVYIRDFEQLKAEIEATAESIKDFDVARVDMELKEKATKQEVQQVTAQLAEKAQKEEVTKANQKIEEFNRRVDQIITSPAEGITEQEIIDARQGQGSLGANLANIKTNLESTSKQLYPVTNLIANGDFTQGITKWEGGSTSTISTLDGYLHVTSTTRPYVKQWGNWRVPANNKLYIKFKGKANKSGVINFGFGTEPNFSNAVNTKELTLSTTNTEFVFTIDTTQVVGGIRIQGTGFDKPGDYIDLKDVIILNLTKTFGAGKEPAISDVNEMLKKIGGRLFDGTVSLYDVKEIYEKTDSIIKGNVPIKLAEDSVGIGNVDFIKSPKQANLLTFRGFAGTDNSTFRMVVSTSENAVVYKLPLEPNQTVHIKVKSPGNRFQIGVNDSIKDTNTGFNFDRLVTINDTLTEYIYRNDEKGKELFLYLNNGTSTIPYKDIVVDFEPAEIEFNKPLKGIQKSFGLKITAIADTTENSITQEKDKYPILCATKYSNARTKAKGYNTHPTPIGWLYYKNEAPYDLMYAQGRPDNLVRLCSWKQSITRNGNSTPENYQFFITKDGDILCIFRGEQIGNELPVNPEARQNPILYPAGDYNNPVVIDFGNRIKPTSWLKNTGADYIYNQDCFIFSEYTRPVHDYSYVWKVTKPYTNPDNWRRVKEFKVAGSMVDGFKHAHTISFDPYSEVTYLTTGDDDSASAIYESRDYGETWSMILGPSEKICRLTNFIYTKDKIYWANDSGKFNYHFLYEVSRGADGSGDFTTVKELWEFPYRPKVQPTYFTALINEPYGLLFLDRFDNPTSEPLHIYFWSFETNEPYLVHTFYPLDGSELKHGFRCDCVNFYQAYSDNRIVCGFGYFQNEMDILGNITGSNKNRINNLALEVVRK